MRCAGVCTPHRDLELLCIDGAASIGVEQVERLSAAAKRRHWDVSCWVRNNDSISWACWREERGALAREEVKPDLLLLLLCEALPLVRLLILAGGRHSLTVALQQYRNILQALERSSTRPSCGLSLARGAGPPGDMCGEKRCRTVKSARQGLGGTVKPYHACSARLKRRGCPPASASRRMRWLKQTKSIGKAAEMGAHLKTCS